MSPLVILLAGGALLGCAMDPAPAPVYASAGARPGTWQQFCEQGISVAHLSALAAARGADGWELVGMSNGVMCFKRPVLDAYVVRPEVRPQAPAYLPTVRDPGF